MAPAENDIQTSESERPVVISVAFRRYAIGLLFLLYVMNYLDRQIVNILAESIKIDLQLRDWQLGMLTGSAFAILYCIAGFPIARLAERHSRPVILGVAAAVWSLFTAACGLTQTFLQFMVARGGVGVGESGCAPTAFSLISDYAPREQRSTALALFSMGAPAGMLLGMVAGGLVAQSHGWRTAFFLCGVPGLLLGLLAAMTLREPRSRASRQPVAGRDADRPGLRREIAGIFAQKSFLFLACGAAINNLLGYGRSAFYAPYFLRNETPDLTIVGNALGVGPLAALGISVGLASGIGGMTGSYLGGVLGDRFGGRDPRWYGLLPALAALLNVPAFIATMMVPLIPALLLLSLASFANTIWYGSVYNAAQSVTPHRSRATAAAIFLSFITLVGLALGPLAIGGLSDLFLSAAGNSSGTALRMALIVSAPLGFVSAAAFFLSSRFIRAELLD
jgi:MFS family permease